MPRRTRSTRRSALESARDALEKTPVVPVENPTKKQLKALVKQAKETDTRGKTAESVKALTDAITYAEDVLGDENASDTQIQAAYSQLKLAIESLKDADSGNQGGSGNQVPAMARTAATRRASPQATRPKAARRTVRRFPIPETRRRRPSRPSVVLAPSSPRSALSSIVAARLSSPSNS